MQDIRILYQTLNTFTVICNENNVQKAVLCPGSRSAAPALSFIRNTGIDHYVINDERSAAYMALGMAEQLNAPVVLLATTGTAALNFAPAIAEAYQKKIPLIVLTSDRPKNLYNKLENQTINQINVYGKNALEGFTIDLTNNQIERNIATWKKALSLAINESGPVQINFHIDEPFYSSGPFSSVLDCNTALDLKPNNNNVLPEHFFNDLQKFDKVLIVAGLHTPDAELLIELKKFIHETQVVFIGDVTSNTHALKEKIFFSDQILKNTRDIKKYIPELVISLGLHQLSKSLTTFLRQNPPRAHWHIDEKGSTPDMYFVGCTNIPHSAAKVFRTLNSQRTLSFSKEYLKLWQEAEVSVHTELHDKILRDKEYGYVSKILSALPGDSVIHLGNSLTVRLADWVKNLHSSIQIFCNRGTSGIDGSLSTALGAAIAMPQKQHFLIIGDQSFVYDQNAFWNNYIPDNLIVFVINNRGGRIFERIAGPKNQPEFEEYFVAHTPYNFELAAKQYGLTYDRIFHVENLNVESILNHEPAKVVLIELVCSQ